jgi:hypothetical protein
MMKVDLLISLTNESMLFLLLSMVATAPTRDGDTVFDLAANPQVPQGSSLLEILADIKNERVIAAGVLQSSGKRTRSGRSGRRMEDRGWAEL